MWLPMLRMLTQVGIEISYTYILLRHFTCTRGLCSACHDSSRRCNRCSKDGDDPVRPPTAERPPALRRRRLTIERLRAPHRGQAPLTQPLVDRLPIINPALFKEYKLIEQPELTKICQSLRSMKRVRISDDPVLKVLRTGNGQSLLGDKLCSDVLFIRHFYGKLFHKIRRNRRVILTGNPGVSKSV